MINHMINCSTRENWHSDDTLTEMTFIYAKHENIIILKNLLQIFCGV